MTVIRNYDIAIPNMVRQLVQKRRTDPDGVCHQVGQIERGRKMVKKYPWDKMLVGDFFVSRLDGTRYDTAANMMYQAARIRDIEVACRRWDVDGEPGIRVVFVMEGLRAIKIAARDHHNVDVRIHSRSVYLKRRAREKAASNARLKVRDNKPVLVVLPKPAKVKKPEPAPILDPGATVAIADSDLGDARAKLMAMRKAAQNGD